MYFDTGLCHWWLPTSSHSKQIDHDYSHDFDGVFDDPSLDTIFIIKKAHPAYLYIKIEQVILVEKPQSFIRILLLDIGAM